MYRQPYAAISLVATIPERTAPIGYPAITILTQKFFVFSGAYSAVMVDVQASILPIPMPLKNRKKINWGNDFAKAVKKTPTPIQQAQSTIIGFLPTISAFDASNIAPKAIPNNPILKAIPKLPALIDHSFPMALEVYDITITSIPSHMFIRKQITIVTYCRAPIWLFSLNM